MSDHLPECECYGRNHGECALCICDRLRACEQRVLDAARDAVEKVGQQHPKWDLISTHYEGCWKSHPECALTLALAVIDALREPPHVDPCDCDRCRAAALRGES